jgi:hypothetical protein
MFRSFKTTIRRFINNKLSLHFITKLHGAMDPLSCDLKNFLHRITMFKCIKAVKISEKIA